MKNSKYKNAMLTRSKLGIAIGSISALTALGGAPVAFAEEGFFLEEVVVTAVSYTHLTLPTILPVDVSSPSWLSKYI